jgi:riboflavin kinase/FMN adenylyltransferase
MRIQGGLASCVGRLTRGALAIGNFDGVHLGHRGLFDAARAAARELSGPAAALTFEPHPAKLLAPEYAPPRITALSRKRELCAAAGLDVLVEQSFDRAFAALEPGAFVDLLAKTGVAQVIVGPDFTYGRDRRGSVDSLRSELSERRIRLHVVPPINVHGLVVSSTKVREFVLEGRVQAAAALLGRPYDLDGEVVRGEGRGRKLGFPTANIDTGAELLPSVGVYAVRARIQEERAPGARSGEDGQERALPARGGGQRLEDTEEFHPPRFGAPIAGAANLGLNPTFRAGAHAGGGRDRLVLEVHLLDTDQDLYGARLRVEFHHRLRDERRFPSVDALRQEIAKDIAEARRLLASR